MGIDPAGGQSKLLQLSASAWMEERKVLCPYFHAACARVGARWGETTETSGGALTQHDDRDGKLDPAFSTAHLGQSRENQSRGPNPFPISLCEQRTGKLGVRCP